MSRSGYSDDFGSDYPGQADLYRASVDRAIAGRRGQKFLQELASAMDSMPEKELIAGELVNEQGQCCTIGVICKLKQMDVEKIDYEFAEEVGNAVGIATSMAAEIEHLNDECGGHETPAQRWTRMRNWVERKLKK